MSARVVAFTEAGCGLAKRIAAELGGQASAPARLAAGAGSGVAAFASLGEWTADAFAAADALVFVGATGIAVRAIAPHVRDKFADPAVVAVDELGCVAVPLLSGHVGGANDLARRIAGITGGLAAVSTATDLNGAFAPDVFAARNGLAVVERGLSKDIAAALLAGRPVGFGGDLGAVVSSDLGENPFPRTLHLAPRDVVVGAGCRRGVAPQVLAAAVDAALSEARAAPQSVCALATVTAKADEPAIVRLCDERGWDLLTFDADELQAVPGDFASSDFVKRAVGVGNVCERAAVAAGGELVLGKRAGDGVTVAVARRRPQGRLFVVGLGPGGGADMTLRARAALQASEVVFGYSGYIRLVADDLAGKDLRASGMRAEVRRCREALEEAARGKTVALVCSGDAGVYGMASPVLQLAGDFPQVQVRVVPGVTAALAGAAELGAPIAHDFAVVSLSDLLTPWGEIERRLAAAARAGLALALYNPASRQRPDHLRRACDVLLRHLPPETVCGLARNVGRPGESARVLTLAQLRDAPADMGTCAFVGTARTVVAAGRMVTPRGYDMSAEAGFGAGAVPAGDGRPRVLVFGGTSEGRELVEWLHARGTCRVAVCTATGYGGELASCGDGVEVLAGRLDALQMERLMREGGFACAVDATHPYADEASANIAAAAERAGASLLRVARDEGALPEEPGSADPPTRDAPRCGTLEDAVRAAVDARGNVFLTTGTNDLPAFVRAMPDFAERLYVRVLPVADSLEAVRAAGVPAAHTVAMQGPFTQEVNEALIRAFGIRLLVTKESGARGGFRQKVEAARACGIDMAVIGRPAGQGGLPLAAVREQLEGRFGL